MEKLDNTTELTKLREQNRQMKARMRYARKLLILLFISFCIALIAVYRLASG
jgi:uncharacterized membrane protein